MRSYIVFILLVAMAGLFVVLKTTRKPVLHKVTVSPRSSEADPGKAKPGKAKPDETKPNKATKAKATKTSKTAAKKAAPKTKPKPRMKRPLRVVSLGWELIAPGVVANGGAKPDKTSLFSKERLQVHLSAFRTMQEVESALARGGADAMGADIAVLPLPEFVASYERLRALSPQVFLVLGWSRGRDGLMAASKVSLTKLGRRKLDLIGQTGRSNTFFSLFVLELAGVAPSKVRILPGDDKRAKKAKLAAMERPLATGSPVGDRRFLVTTADATRLIPMVAVAPAGLIKSHQDALTAWGQVWLAGVEQLHKDVPAASRQVAKLKNAPHALDLLKRLGQIDAAPLMDNARLAGLSGRSAVSLGGLFERVWKIWRESGVLSSPMPKPVPVHVGIMSAMVRTYPALVEAEPPKTAPAKAKPGQGPADGAPRLIHRPKLRRWDGRALATRVGLLASVFERAVLKVSVRENIARARKLVAQVTDRFDLPGPGRIQPKSHKGNGLARVELTMAQ